jgi:TrmH family RNA methyltransferase
LVSRSVTALVRDLRLRKGRERRGLALAEGVRLVEEALAAGLAIRQVLASPALEGTERGRQLQAALVVGGHPYETITDEMFESLAATEHPQGILAVIEPPRWTIEQIRVEPRKPVLVLDAVQDPGNVGTMLRTAWALGAAGVIALPGTAELTNPKVLRASMGGAFRIPCVPATEPELRQWTGRNRVKVLLAEAGAALPAPDEQSPIALVVGNEGAGTSESLTPWASGRVGIPLRAGADSLNVAIAAAILLYEVTRD